jgi:hypothetical protein
MRHGVRRRQVRPERVATIAGISSGLRLGPMTAWITIPLRAPRASVERGPDAIVMQSRALAAFVLAVALQAQQDCTRDNCHERVRTANRG